jgi:hypothetical protein
MRRISVKRRRMVKIVAGDGGTDLLIRRPTVIALRRWNRLGFYRMQPQVGLRSGLLLFEPITVLQLLGEVVTPGVEDLFTAHDDGSPAG